MQITNPRRAATLRRAVPLAAFALASSVVACAQAATFALQHAVGASIGACRASKDSVERARGTPYRRYMSDEEEVTTRAQVFWHEWAYRDTAREAHQPADSVSVVGFRWGDDVVGCDVRQRRAAVPGPRGKPWDGAGEVPRT